jgi:HEAT repeat protein
VLEFWSPRVDRSRRRRDVPAIVEALRTGGVRARRAAANALVAIPDARATDALVAGLRDDDELVRTNSALALGELTGPQSAGEVLKSRGALVDALSDSEPRVRAMAASALGRTKATEAVEPLIGALDDSDLLVRRTATVVLQAFDDPRAAEALAR